MIDVFESMARTYPNRAFFTFVDAKGMEVTYTYRQARLAAAAVARRLRTLNVRAGDYVVVDLPNCPEYVFLILAAAYGSFTLVTLNQRLSEGEKTKRLMGLERGGVRVAFTIDERRLGKLFGDVRLSFVDEATVIEGVYGSPSRDHAIMGARQDAIEDTVHFAEREAHLFDPDTRAVVMFTSGTTGHPKAVGLSWARLVASAASSNRVLNAFGEGAWQAVLPLCHVGGLQVIVRSVTNRSPFRLYERFDAERVLHDVEKRRVTHIAVVDKMLRDLIAVEAERASRRRSEGPSRLARYQCILLGGGPLNLQTLDDALDLRAHVFASYGMTETASQIANAEVTSAFDGGLELLPGYAVRIVDPGADGFGRLAVKGPGVFDGYLNARAAFTVDGFFLTGDTAALRGSRIYLKERTADMFVSGGENIYPVEIANAIRRVPGVGDAFVFGVPHPTWGRRPVAVVERSKPDLSAADVLRGVQGALSKLTTPDDVMVVDRIPRKGIGKIDRAAVQELYEKRLAVRKVVLHRVRLPFRTPFKTAQKTLTHRDLVIVEVVDHAGRVGLGECVAFDTDWYLPETLDESVRFMKQTLIPVLRGTVYAHPREVAASFERVGGLTGHAMATSALEMALWDLYGRIEGRPLWALLNEEYERLSAEEGLRLPVGLERAASTRGASALVPAGAVVGIAAPAAAVEQAAAAVRAGYRRVKMKIAPGQGLAAVRAVREAFPSLLITLDANQSFGDADLDELRAYDALGIGWIEEPLDVRRPGFAGGSDALARLARLQRTLSTPICVDESYDDIASADRILGFRDLRCINVKLSKLGSITWTLRFIAHAQARGREVWIGGMYDAGISKRVHAALETLPGVVMPGDVSTPSRYFDADIAKPPYVSTRGYVLLNGTGYEAGIGCELNLEEIARVLVRRETIE